MLKADVAVPLPIETTLAYLVPEELKSVIRIGSRVAVPVKSKVLSGFVCALSEVVPGGQKLKAIREVVDRGPVISAELMDLAGFVSDHYAAPIGEVLAAMSPPQAKLKQVYTLKRPPGDLELEIMRATHPERAQIVDMLLKGKPLRLDTIRQKTALKAVRDHLKALEDEGFIGHEVVASKRRRSGKGLARPDTPLDLEQTHPLPQLTPHQRAAYEGICSSIDGGAFRKFLLFGVTGSGKTEVYLRCIDHAVGRGKRAIYLVPEIALTPQIMERVRERFRERCALLHSRVSDAERYATWQNIMSDRVDIVVGARSAVFAPVHDLGVIVIDEEHDTSYKQQDSPRYDARQVAISRARQAGAVVILGSATPSIEAYHGALEGEYGLFELPERISGEDLPEVRIVDMRSTEGHSLISKEAENAIHDSIERHEQVLLFLNRRGFSNYVQCRDCGLVPHCRNCQVSLTYHTGGRRLKCHYCGYAERGWDTCPRCGGSNVEYVGSGTQRIEDYIAERFPGVACARFDRDSTSRRGSTEALLTDFDSGLVRFLVGTQMVAKGHDFKRVGLVVVVNADTSMNLPDFRSAERTFQILTQVAGRAGRGDVPGRVIIQTFNPDHHSLSFVASHDFKGFYGEESGLRRELRYPPFARLIRIVAESGKQAAAETAARQAAVLISRLGKRLGREADVVGPSRAPISRIKKTYRWHLLIKGTDASDLSALVREALNRLKAGPAATGVRFSIDVDPQVMM